MKFLPVNPLEMPRFGDIATFNRLPYFPNFSKSDNVNVAIIGVPFDGATTFRPGARFGPRAVREASVLCRNYNPTLKVGIYDELNIVDAGDVSVNPINILDTFKKIENRVSLVHQFGVRSICVGGDHSILLPILRSMKSLYQNLTLIHFDAHTDTGDMAWGEKYHHGTPIRRAIEERLIAGPNIFQIGIRGPLTAKQQDDYLSEKKINILTMDHFHHEKKRKAFFRRVFEVGKRGPCYLTFDIDGVDPAFAPGTGTPVVGGLTSHEALTSVRELAGLHFVGADLVEVSPPYDHSEITSLLGAALLFEFMSLMALNPKLAPRKSKPL